MYKARMIASAVVHKENIEGFAEIVKPAIAAICSGELSERINPNGSYSVFATVTDPDFSYNGQIDEWAESLAERLTPYCAVKVSLYLTDEDGVEYWASGEYEEEGRNYYIIYVGEDEDMAQVDSSEVIWG